jgi:hypothetical protein
MNSSTREEGSILIAFFKSSFFNLILVAFTIAVLLALNESVFQLAHDNQKLLKRKLVLVRIQILHKVFSLVGITAQAFQNCLQMSNIYKTGFFLIEHVENALEIFNFLLRIGLEDFVVY